ncbi:MAG: energy transducer TonB [Gammaproteobacteria bacterium]|tara:strand:+ start:468 stop:1091 length:624 start_codon:yes stop_codon:yes gene_type:complete
MTSISSVQITSKRSLTFNKSFMLSIVLHLILIFGVTLTTFYKSPVINESPVINVKFANSNQDSLGTSFGDQQKKLFQIDADKGLKVAKSPSSNFQTYKVKKLQSNSIINSDEAIYLNLWQRKIESVGDKMISENTDLISGKVQIMATIDATGELIKSEILISSGDKSIDEMAIKILQESSPFEAFHSNMSNDYSFLEIVRDWNFSSY